MAELTPDFTFQRSGRPTKYPWDDWSDGQTRTLTRGIDFDCQTEAFQNAVYVYARRHNLKARTQRIEVDRVAVQLTPIA